MRHRPIVFVAIAAILALALAGADQQSAEQLYKSALYEEEVGGDLQKAIAVYQDLLKRFPASREVAAKAQLHIGLCYEKLGTTEAEKAFQKVVSDYPERTEEVRTARQKLSLIAKTRPVAGGVDLGPSIRQIWSGTSATSDGRPSPDGKSMSFIDGQTGNLGIRDIASGSTRLVTHKGSFEKDFGLAANSCWSPDGKRFAYSWMSQTSAMELRVIDASGANERILYQMPNDFAFPIAWSPDGRTIAVSLVQDLYTSWSVAVISADDGSLRILKKVKLLKTVPRGMAFSLDSRFLYVDLPQNQDDPKHDIFAFSVDGQEDTRVVEHPSDDWVLGRLPGSDRLLISSDRTGTHDAWLIDIADAQPRGEPVLVRRNLGMVDPLGIDQEGRFFYRLNTQMVDIAVASVDLKAGTLVEAPKVLPQALVGVSYDPRWSPDGKSLAFVVDSREAPGGRISQALMIRSLETGETREVPTKITRFTRPRWAPDGRSIFVVGNDGKTSLALYRIDISTGEATFYVDSEPGANIKFMTPSSEGNFVYYTYFEFSKKCCSIRRIDLATKESRDLFQAEAPPDIGELVISPNGKQLAFSLAEPGWPNVIRIIDLPDGTPRDLVKMKERITGNYIWAPDGKGIIAFKNASNEKELRCELWFFPAEGGEPRSLGLSVDGEARSLGLHPDGRRLAYSVRQPSAEIWIMENFLPVEKR
jgi:Tol biopolymer transport system component